MMSLLGVSVAVLLAVTLCAFIAFIISLGSRNHTDRGTQELLVGCRWLRWHWPSAQALWNFFVMLFTAALALVAWQQYRFGNTIERAYVVFGSRDGSLAEVGALVDGKPIIKLHFFNSGRSVARHFAVHVYTCAAGDNISSFPQRHRAEGPHGEIMTSGSSNEVDLGGGAEHAEYITDPKFLWTSTQLANPGGYFCILGQMEYCDIFGGYHCENFGARYLPSVGVFVSNPWLMCRRETFDPRNVIEMGKAVTYREVEPCEQPDEPEYQRWPTATR